MRNIAKVAARKIDLKQKFYSGKIYLNAVDHSWAWTGTHRYESFDGALQKLIYNTSTGYDHFIDIGCNLGVMSIGTLLNNPQIEVVAIDANKKAIDLLKKSLAYNGLTKRCTVLCKAVGNQNGHIKFDTEGSVIGHIADTGTDVEVIKLSDLLNKYSQAKTLVKVDVEGYELQLIGEFSQVNNLKNFKFIIELHPIGFNGVGNPQYFVDELLKLGANIVDPFASQTTEIDIYGITQIVVTF